MSGPELSWPLASWILATVSSLSLSLSCSSQMGCWGQTGSVILVVLLNMV
jgi:hypothetical protein